MAGKAHRAASRQGQLSRRRKKGQRGPSGIPQIQHPGGPAAFGASTGSVAETRDAVAAATESAESAAESAPAAAASSPAPAAPAAAPRRAAPARTSSAANPAPAANGSAAAATPAPRGQTAPRSGRARNERPPAYNYVGAELRRIGVLSVAVVAALVVLGIVL